MKKSDVVMPVYVVRKVIMDTEGRLLWERNWYFHEWEIGAATMTYIGAFMYYLPGLRNSDVYLIRKGIVLEKCTNREYGHCGQPLIMHDCLLEECDNCIFGNGGVR